MQNPEARFIISAARPEQFPGEDLPEIAFLGRSNVGKSSLLNAITGSPGLAKTSSTPGRTQTVNFFRVANRFLFVDLPGYGFARVPKEIAQSWKKLIESYLARRPGPDLCLVLLDARRGWMEKDLELREWLEFHGRKYIVAATKFDKLKSQKERHAALNRLNRYQAEAPAIPFSAVTGQGVREIWQTILKTPTNR
ncbi:MAG: ribosome biogenesis GTP-binding protein YihA/YsxC [Bryobacteraceae bacterium]